MPRSQGSGRLTMAPILRAMAPLLLVMLATVAPAMELVLSSPHPAVRPELLHRLRIQVQDVPEGVHDSLRGNLRVSITAGDHLLHEEEFIALSAGALAAGMTLNWIAPPSWPDAPLQAHALWDIPGQALRARRPLADVLAASRALVAVADAVEASDEALPRLWLEQAALELRGPTDLHGAGLVIERLRRLRAWQEGSVTATDSAAFRDPRDGSVQPYRWYAAKSPAHGTVLAFVDRAEQALGKSRWPSMESELRAAIVAGGWNLLHIYPAGDRGWHDIALWRAHDLLQRHAGEGPIIGLGIGHGAAGHLRAALSEPGRYQALVLIDGQWDSADDRAQASDELSAQWRQLTSDPQQRLAHLQGLPIYQVGSLGRGLQWLDRHRQRQTAEFWHPQPREVLRRQQWWADLATGPGQPALLNEYRVLQAGPLGPWLIDELEQPLRGGHILRHGDTLDVVGIRGLRWRGEALLASPLQVAPARGQQPPPLLSSYASGPFVLVLGEGEHAAAAANNRRLLRRFLSDWGHHAEGRPQVVQDGDFIAEDWAGHHLVVLGGPRSNRVSAEVLRAFPQLPLRWDHRQLSIDGVAHLRSEGLGVAIALADPRRPQRSIIIVDGAPCWPSGGLPLSGLGNLAWILPEQLPRMRFRDSPWPVDGGR